MRPYKALMIVSVLCAPAAGLAYMPYYPLKDDRSDRTAIVTGATGRIGVGTCHWLAKRKVRVIMAARDMQKCKLIRRELVAYTGHKAIACRHLDLEDIDSINAFAKRMIEEEPHIDILINNAAVKELKEKEITKYGVEKHYWVNFLAPFLLTFRLMDKLKGSASQTLDSRVVNVIGKPKTFWNIQLDDINFDKRKYSGKEAYRQSKLALAYFTILLDKMCTDSRSFVYVFGSNPVRKWIAESEVRDHSLTLLEKFQLLFRFIYTIEADRCAQPAINCALHPVMNHRDYSGKLYGLFNGFWGWGGADAEKDEVFAKMVWNHAIETLKLAPENIERMKKMKQQQDLVAKAQEASPSPVDDTTAASGTKEVLVEVTSR
ncbi:uncharacterized protein LOC143868903 [Tasmannia lanceolata]|uniref:uncharacterized protein LOC143868903 n=1 Tax=Tasmannia lanceolata TaxID=3420 RepID=UPI0040645896